MSSKDCQCENVPGWKQYAYKADVAVNPDLKSQVADKQNLLQK